MRQASLSVFVLEEEPESEPFRLQTMAIGQGLEARSDWASSYS
jgi:hypothetical protein